MAQCSTAVGEDGRGAELGDGRGILRAGEGWGSFNGHATGTDKNCRYRFHIFLAYFLGLFLREYPQKIWPKKWYVYVAPSIGS